MCVYVGLGSNMHGGGRCLFNNKHTLLMFRVVPVYDVLVPSRGIKKNFKKIVDL